MAQFVYLLCTLTSLACAVLLLRGYAESQVRLLLWSGFCFAGLAVNNALLFLDLVILPDVDLSAYRLISGLLSMMILLYGLVWDLE